MIPRKPVYHGWRIAWALAVTQTVGFGVLYYTFSVMIVPMERELGWSRGEISGAFSLALLFSGLVAIPVGRFVDAHGARGLMTVGASLGALLLLAWSFVTDLTAFYLVQAGIGLVMAAVLYDVAFTVIAVWFQHERTERAKAMLLVTMLAGLASTIFIPLATFLTQTLGWREALRVLALILAVLTVPLHALVVRRRPQVLEATPPDLSMSLRPAEAMRMPTFWWLTCAFALDRVAIVAIAAHSVPLLSERGYSPGFVAAVAGSIGLTQVLGRFLFTPLMARVSLRTLSAFTFGLHASALISLLVISSPWSVWLFAACFGIANGASTLARAALIAEIYGSAHYGTISGSMATVIAPLQTVAPLGVGALFDLTGGYTLALWGLTGVTVLAAIAIIQVQTSHAPELH